MSEIHSSSGKLKKPRYASMDLSREFTEDRIIEPYDLCQEKIKEWPFSIFV